jgi:hypothetical protein
MTKESDNGLGPRLNGAIGTYPDTGNNYVNLNGNFVSIGEIPNVAIGKLSVSGEREPMTKEDIEKQIAELKGKLEEMKPKKPEYFGLGGTKYNINESVAVNIENIEEEYIRLTVSGSVYLDCSEAKSIIQALQKCVDWLESK